MHGLGSKGGLNICRECRELAVHAGLEKRVYAPRGIEGEAGKWRGEKWAETSGRETAKALSAV